MDETLELQQQIVRLEALFEASRRIHSTIQIDEVLRCALDIDGEAILDHIWYAVERFTEETEQRDDVTALVPLRQ